MPHAVDSSAFEAFLQQIDELGEDRVSPRLAGSLHQDYGLAIFATHPAQAALHFQEAARLLALSPGGQAFERLQQTTMVLLNRLFYTHITDPEERRGHALRYQTIRTLGELLVEHIPRPFEIHRPKYLKKAAGTGAEVGVGITALLNPSILPSLNTKRQNHPLIGPGKHAAIVDDRLILKPNSDYNFYFCDGNDVEPFKGGRIEVKAHDELKEYEYDPDVTVVCADRDLGIKNLRLLRGYGEELSRYTGMLTPVLEAALEGLKRAIGRRSWHFYDLPGAPGETAAGLQTA